MKLFFFAGENKTSRENEPLTESPDGEPMDKHMALYEVNTNVDMQIHPNERRLFVFVHMITRTSCNTEDRKICRQMQLKDPVLDLPCKCCYLLQCNRNELTKEQ